MRLGDEKQLTPEATPFTLAIQRVYLHEGEAYYVAANVSRLEHPMGGSALMAAPGGDGAEGAGVPEGDAAGDGASPGEAAVSDSFESYWCPHCGLMWVAAHFPSWDKHGCPECGGRYRIRFTAGPQPEDVGKPSRGPVFRR